MQYDIKADESTKSTVEMSNDPTIIALANKTPNQAEQWANDYITDLTTAKEVISKLTKIIAYYLRHLDNG